MKITNKIFTSFLQCKYKGYLLSIEKEGTKTEFEILNNEQLHDNKQLFFKNISAKFKQEELIKDVLITSSKLNTRFKYFFDVSIQNEHKKVNIDALFRKTFESYYLYEPVLVISNPKVSIVDKLLLTFISSSINELRGQQIEQGRIIYGYRNYQKSLNVKLRKFYKDVVVKIDEIKNIVSKNEVPNRILNNHCQICEFKETCYNEIKKEDGLSLLRTLKEKNIYDLNNRGIFTVTQLSYTFRPRRIRKINKVKIPNAKHIHSLKALAIRENKIYIYKKPVFPKRKIKIYLDIEGDPDRKFYYLIGAVIDTGKKIKQYSFWIIDENQIIYKVDKFLETIGGYKNFTIYHYGNYENKFFHQIDNTLKQKYSALIQKISQNSVNVLSFVYSSIYFPTYSNQLKEISNYLGFEWSNDNSSGLQSIIWRRRWEKTQNKELKKILITYNIEDCLALKNLVEFITIISKKEKIDENTFPSLKATENFQNLASQTFGWTGFAKQNFFLENFDYINKCSYFNYQRDKVFIKTNNQIKKIKRKITSKKKTAKINQEIVYQEAKFCPKCRSKNIHTSACQRERIIADLKFFKGGIKKWIIKYKSNYQRCQECGKQFLPKEYKNIWKTYGHNLLSWVVYQNIVNFISYDKTEKILVDIFNISIGKGSAYNFKAYAAEYYKKTYNKLVADVKNWEIIHVDETSIRVQGEKCYVWVFTNMNTVFFKFTKTRKTDFLPKLLKGFNGILISDFYTGYNILDCPKQKCLIHLIRDINTLLFKNQQNEELIYVAEMFSSLLRKIVDSIDKFGLKKRYLNKHKKDVDIFYKEIRKKSFNTDVASKLIKRFDKNDDSLFTFLNFNNVPWNNNNAEHAFKHFAQYRRNVNGTFSEISIHRYLILLSIYQTCNYRSIDFLKFMHSKEKYIENYSKKYTASGNRRKRPLSK